MQSLLLQLADSAFPTGGFAHSQGLEAWLQLSAVQGRASLARFIDEALVQAGYGALPFVNACHAAPARLATIDASADLFLRTVVANRASRAQGRAFVATAAAVFEVPAMNDMAAHIRAHAVAGHHAPHFGAVCALLGVSLRDTQRIFMHQTLRGVASAAVRLGLWGPLEAQRGQLARAPAVERILERCGALREHQATQTAPLLEAFGAHHDSLYSRLFQS